MADFWLDFLEMGDPSAGVLIVEVGDDRASSYQFKWDVLRSVATRSIAGTLRHLPSGRSTPVRVRLPF